MEDIDKRTLPKNIDVIKQISQTKREQSRKEILISSKDFTTEQSDKQLAIPTHRKKNHISLEEYQNLLKQGNTVPEIIEKTSKHLTYFYNALLKGRINLPKEKFEKMYTEGKSLDEISVLENIPREHMTYLREFYGIKRKGAKYQKRLTNEQPLSQEAKDIIIGSILGDGYISKWGYFSEKHSPEQLEYLKWKGSFLKSITTDKSWAYYESIDKRSGSLIKSHNFRTTTHSFLYEMRNKFYNNKGVKIIPNDIANLINDKVLTIWFMDDGVTDWAYRCGIKQSTNSMPTCSICSESFSIEENIKLSETILKNFNINSQIKFHDNTQKKPRLWFSTVESKKLVELIKTHIHNDLLYKINEETYLEKYLKTKQPNN